MEYKDLQGHYFTCREKYCLLCDKYEEDSETD